MLAVAGDDVTHGLNVTELCEEHGGGQTHDEGSVVTADLPCGTEEHGGCGPQQAVHSGRRGVGSGVHVRTEPRSLAISRSCGHTLLMDVAVGQPFPEPDVQVHSPA